MLTNISAISATPNFVKTIGNFNTGNLYIAMSTVAAPPVSVADVVVVPSCLRAGIFQGTGNKRRGCHG